MNEKYDIEQLKDAARKAATERKKNAKTGDGGASLIFMQIQWYEKGQRGEYPKEWEIHEQYVDPEYAEYLRLQKKFGKERG